MQPYFYPYLGYFALIKHTDRWIVFDNVQYIEKGWINRNRIIHPSRPEDMYITIPVEKHERSAKICDIKIKDNYQEKILGQIAASYRKRAKHFETVYEMVETALGKRFKGIAELDEFVIGQICNYLSIPFEYSVFSRMGLNIEEAKEPDDWALNISRKMGADIYINPPGGYSFFNAEKYKEYGIDLQFLRINLQPYEQKKGKFIEGLSILDVMMFNSPDEINNMLDNYVIFRK